MTHTAKSILETVVYRIFNKFSQKEKLTVKINILNVPLWVFNDPNTKSKKLPFHLLAMKLAG